MFSIRFETIPANLTDKLMRHRIEFTLNCNSKKSLPKYLENQVVYNKLLVLKEKTKESEQSRSTTCKMYFLFKIIQKLLESNFQPLFGKNV